MNAKETIKHLYKQGHIPKTIHFCTITNEINDLQAENIKQKVCISYLSEGVAKLWDSVSDGMHDARSLVGDTTLGMQENLMQIGIDARGKKALKGKQE